MHNKTGVIVGALVTAFGIYSLFLIIREIIVGEGFYFVLLGIFAFPFLPLISLAQPVASATVLFSGGVIFYYGFRFLSGWMLYVYFTILFSIMTFVFLYLAVRSTAGA